MSGPSRDGDWLTTASGRRFWPFDPRPEDVDIKDIAHALSHQCRFAGHTASFYSVAQHSVHVAELCPPEDALWGLLHDASEAYLVDLPRPLKNDPRMAPYRLVEERVMHAVCRAFGLTPQMPASVALADEIMLATEARDLMRGSESWRFTAAPRPGTIEPWPPEYARCRFLRVFERLWEGGECEGGPAAFAHSEPDTGFTSVTGAHPISPTQ